MTRGILSYDANAGLYDVLNDRGESLTFCGLCCGYLLEVKINGRFRPTRIEMRDDWYLVGFEQIADLEGLIVRIR